VTLLFWKQRQQTPLKWYQTAWHHIPEDDHYYSLWLENIQSCWCLYCDTKFVCFKIFQAFSCGIWGFHGSDCKDCCPEECDAVLCGTSGPSFQRSFLPALSRNMRDVAASVDFIYTRRYHIPGNSSLLVFSYHVDVIADYCYHFCNYMKFIFYVLCCLFTLREACGIWMSYPVQ